MADKDVDLTREELEKLTEEVTDPETTRKFKEILEETRENNSQQTEEETEKETIETLDGVKLWKEYVKWGRQKTEIERKMDYILYVTIHSAMTLVTAGLWFFLLLAYWVYQFKTDLERREADIFKEWEEKMEKQ